MTVRSLRLADDLRTLFSQLTVVVLMERDEEGGDDAKVVESSSFTSWHGGECE